MKLNGKTRMKEAGKMNSLPKKILCLLSWSGLVILAGSATNPVCAAKGLRIERAGTAMAYFTHNGKPLLSFGGLSDFVFYAAEDAYDYKVWADWAAEYGINHVRAYPPLSWKYVEVFAKDNGGALGNVLFPYKQTQSGSRQFDLTKFDEAYWRRFRKKCEYLESKGVIIHLLMWNGWQLRASDTPGRDKDDEGKNWGGHFFNPRNNVNAFTDHLGGNLERRFAIYHSVADGKRGLLEAQKMWFKKLVEVTADLDNVYYDLVHEIREHHRNFSKVRPWIEEMAATVRSHHKKLRPDVEPILGMDTGGLNESQRHWIFTRPYFDLLIYGKKHTVTNARNWRVKYKKPYIPQESWDDDGTKYSYRCPNQRVAIRKYMWKFMMAKCQQLDLYMKPRVTSQAKGAVNPPGHDHNYDPRGWNKFEDDAKTLAAFWASLRDYPNLWFGANIDRGPGSHRYVLSSKKEAVIYCSSATAKEGVLFKSDTLRLTGLRLSNGRYKVDIVRSDVSVVSTRTVDVKDARLSIQLPSFTDDIAVHVYGPR
ncbi:MAG: hypothetical protein ACYS9C_12020 [Planctomycetota bacterium]|jgi:hypothetical protein